MHKFKRIIKYITGLCFIKIIKLQSIALKRLCGFDFFSTCITHYEFMMHIVVFAIAQFDAATK